MIIKLETLRHMERLQWIRLTPEQKRYAIKLMMAHIADQHNNIISIRVWDDNKFNVFPNAKNICKIWFADRAGSSSLRLLAEHLGHKFKRDMPDRQYGKMDKALEREAVRIDKIKEWIATERDRGFGLQVCHQYDAVDEHGHVWTVSMLR